MSLDFTIPELHIGNAGTPPIQFYKQGLKIGGSGTTPTYQDIVLSGNGSLSLTNAKANGLNYLKLFGKCEQRNLPEGYTQLEYLRSDGTQYIDLGYKGNGNTKVRIKTRYYTATSSSGSGRIFGSRNAAAVDAFSLGSASGTASTNSTIAFFFGNQSYLVTNKAIVLDEWLDIVFDKTIHSINGVDYGDPYNDETFETPQTLKIFGFDNSGTMGFGYIDVAQHQLWNNGVLVRDLIPAKNSSNVLGMYDTVTNTFLTNQGTGTFTAGPTAVPTPDTPIDIVCNNGVLKFGVLSTNLLDLANCTDGYYYTPAGEYAATPNARLSNYIPVKAGVTYTVGLTGTEGQSNVRINLFDTAKNWLSQTVFVSYAGEKRAQSITPTQDGFLAFSANYLSSSRVDWNTAQVVQGSYTAETMPEYEPYRTGIYTDGTVETVEVHSPNLFKSSDITTSTVSDVTISVDSEGVITANGTSSNPNYSQFVFPLSNPITEGTYTVSLYNSETLGNGSLVGFAINTTVSGRGTPLTTANSTKTITVNSGETCNNVVIRIAGTANQFKFKIQIEKGSERTAYSSYFNGGTATAEMLLKVGDYQDVQSVLDGEVTRKVGIKVLDGSEWWTQSAATNNLFYTTINNSSTDNTYIPVSSNFQGVVASTGYATMTNGQFKHGSSTNSWYFKNTDCANATAFSQWLADQYNSGNPVVVVYPLATATTESVESQELTIQAGTNIVEITQASIDNLGLEVSYKGTV